MENKKIEVSHQEPYKNFTVSDLVSSELFRLKADIKNRIEKNWQLADCYLKNKQADDLMTACRRIQSLECALSELRKLS